LFFCIHLTNNRVDCDVGFAACFEPGDALPAFRKAKLRFGLMITGSQHCVYVRTACDNPSRYANFCKCVRQHLASATFRLIGITKNVAYHNATAFDRKQGEGTRKPGPNRTVTIGVGSNRWRSSHDATLSLSSSAKVSLASQSTKFSLKRLRPAQNHRT
jgi:hypothetical protein